MDLQYKPTKPKKEKPEKAPKKPKAEKPIKIGTAQKLDKPKKEKAPKAEKPVIDGVSKVKLDKPKKVKEPKANDAKAENAPEIKSKKVKAFVPIFKGDKMDVGEGSDKSNVLNRLNPIVAISALAAVVLVAVLVFTLVIPAFKKQGEAIKEIQIVKLPTKTTYVVGEESDYNGLRVRVTRNNGETFIVRANDCVISGFNTDIPIEKLTVTVSYGGVEDEFAIKVEKHEKPAPVLERIYLDPLPKTEYKDGEYLDINRCSLIRVYMDGTTNSINLKREWIHGWEKVSGPGIYTLTVKYAENGVLCTFDYQITVTE